MVSIDIKGEIGVEVRSADVIKKINSADGKEDILLDISSPGGLVSESLEITDRLIEYPGKVEAIINPYACSGASLISTAADEVFVYSSSVWMAHFSAGILFGKAADHYDYAKRLSSIDDYIINYYMRRSKQSYFEVYAFLEKELFLTGQEAIDAGYADTMIDEPAEMIGRNDSKIRAESAFSSMAAAMAENISLSEMETLKSKKLGLEGLTAEDIQAMKMAGQTPAEYRKYSRMMK